MKTPQFQKLSRRLFIGSLIPVIAAISCSKDKDPTQNPDPDGLPDIPDKEGMTVKGIVHSDGVGIPNVVVSDGIDITKTDSQGIYYLPSTKVNPYVFISIPSKYEVATDRGLPKFFQSLNLAANVVETKHFALTPVDNTKHVVLAMTDLHLARRNNDITQFEMGFLRDANEIIKSYKDKGIRVYGLTMGDLTWETYWYANNYFLDDYLAVMSELNIPVFNTMGNHDNDPYFEGDLQAEQTYKRIVGPSYYSFNLGDIHYVVLDNVEYINKGGRQGTLGDRTYNGKVVNTQMEWLKKDLSMIDKHTPIIVAMHIQLNNRPILNSKGMPESTLRLDNATEVIEAFNGFNNVHFLTGHVHVNYAWENTPHLMEHNTGAVCATWWWTGRDGYAGNHICKDGSPGGYSIWEINRNDIKWQYKSIGHEKSYQFRSYDLNECHITASKYAPNSTDALLLPYVGEYAEKSTKNEVLINVWGFDEEWTVEVTERGKSLIVTRVDVKDPLHIISYEALRLNVGQTPTRDFVSSSTSHMFKVTSTNADSPLIIKVTDRFGRVYKETMERPKALTYLMI